MNNSLWNASGTFAKILLNLVTIPVIIKANGIYFYGQWVFISSVLMIFLLAEGGIASAGTIIMSESKSKEEVQIKFYTILKVMVYMCVLISILPIILTRFISEYLYVSFGSIFPVAIIGFVGAFRLIQNPMISLLQSELKYKKLNIIQTLQSLIYSLAIIFTTIIYKNLLIMIISQAIVGLIFAFIYFYQTKFEYKSYISVKTSVNEVREIFSRSIYFWISSVSETGYSYLMRIVVGIELGSYNLGIFGVITTMSSQLAAVVSSFVQPIVPEASKNKDDVLRLREIYIKSVKRTLLISFILLLISILAYPAIHLIIEKKIYFNSYLLGFLAFFLISNNSSPYYLMFSTGLQKSVAIISLVSTVISLLGLLTLSKFYGLSGAIMSLFFYSITLLYHVFFWRSLKKWENV